MEKMKSKVSAKKDIKEGSVSLDSRLYLNKKNHKIRISAFIDGDLYEELHRRAEAGEGKGRYQTLMNELLRQAVFSEERPPQTLHCSKADLKKVFKEFLSELKVPLRSPK